MPAQCLSLHRVVYDTTAKAFRAEAQFVDATGIHRRGVFWPGPFTAEFARIARGLRDAAFQGPQVDFPSRPV